MSCKRQALIIGCASLLLFASGAPLSGQSLAEKFFEQKKSPAAPAAVASAALAADAITAISIEHQSPARQYRATLNSDGTAEFVGGKGAPRSGTFRGTLDAAVFRGLAEEAIRIDYLNLKDTYKSFRADSATVYTAVKAGAVEKIIMDYDRQGPEALRAFEDRLEQVVNQIQWVQP